jgi:hypothetical protein
LSVATSHRRVLGGFLLLLCLAGTRADAQGLPTAVTSAIVIQAPDEASIAEFVAQNTRNLSSKEAAARQADKVAVLSNLEPLKTPSTAFRIAYSRALKPALTRAMQAGQEGAIVALAIAGELATLDALELIRQGMASPNPMIRHQAAGLSSRSVLRIALHAGDNPSISKAEVDRLITALKDGALAEHDEIVLDAWVNSLAKAGENPECRTMAYAALEEVIEAQARLPAGRLTPLRRQAMLRAMDEVFKQVSAAGVTLDARAGRSLARMCGLSLARVMAEARAQRIIEGEAEPERRVWAGLAGACENVLVFAGRSLSPGFAGPVPAAAARLREGTRGGDADFLIAAEAICGANGMLSKAPFNFPPDAFIK